MVKLALAFAIFGTISEAQPIPACDTVAAMTETLATLFKETLYSVGVLMENKPMAIFTSPNGTWSIVALIEPDKACIINSGTQWQLFERPLIKD